MNQGSFQVFSTSERKKGTPHLAKKKKDVHRWLLIPSSLGGAEFHSTCGRCHLAEEEKERAL